MLDVCTTDVAICDMVTWVEPIEGLFLKDEDEFGVADGEAIAAAARQKARRVSIALAKAAATSVASSSHSHKVRARCGRSVGRLDASNAGSRGGGGRGGGG